MKWYLMPILAALIFLPILGFAQRIEVLPIGNIAPTQNRSPSTWAQSGLDIIHLTQSHGAWTPDMRTQRMDARTIEILTRTQVPQLSRRDIRSVTRNGRQYLVVRRYLLAEVLPQDAKAAGLSVSLLAQRWLKAAQYALPQIAPLPSRFGV